jgi:hypothetical protein
MCSKFRVGRTEGSSTELGGGRIEGSSTELGGRRAKGSSTKLGGRRTKGSGEPRDPPSNSEVEGPRTSTPGTRGETSPTGFHPFSPSGGGFSSFATSSGRSNSKRRLPIWSLAKGMRGEPMEAIKAIIPKNFLQENVFGRVPPERFNDVLVHQQIAV